ncbi:MAG: hypothetical protein U0169_08615 [Polyangiaceae bacterium]
MISLRKLAVVAVTGFVSLLARDAFAQTPPPAAPAAPAAAPGAPAAPAAPAAAPADPAAPTTLAPPPAPGATPVAGATAPAEGGSEDPDFKGARFRWGISPIGGALMSGGATAGGGGIDLRFGAQITRMFGVYAQPVAIIGGSSGAAGGSATVMGGNAVIADFTFADMVFVGVGPEVLGGASASAGTAGAAASSGVNFSLAARAGVILGSQKPERRRGFLIAFDMRTIFTAGSPTITPMLGLGYETY